MPRLGIRVETRLTGKNAKEGKGGVPWPHYFLSISSSLSWTQLDGGSIQTASGYFLTSGEDKALAELLLLLR